MEVNGELILWTKPYAWTKTAINIILVILQSIKSWLFIIIIIIIKYPIFYYTVLQYVCFLHFSNAVIF